MQNVVNLIGIRGVSVSWIMVNLHVSGEIVYVRCMLHSAFMLILICCCISVIMVSVKWGYACVVIGLSKLISSMGRLSSRSKSLLLG